jgi:predicted esterase
VSASLERPHIFLPADDSAAGPPLLLLHGTGGDERDLLPLRDHLSPGAAVLSVRGNVLENGMPRFFRRIREGVFDEDDLRRRADELSEFVVTASQAYGIEEGALVAVGFSNGANIAASLLLLHPAVLRRAVLFSAMPPIEPDAPPDLQGVSVYMTGGRRDTMVDPDETQRLATMLQQAGASVTLRWKSGGHEISRDDVDGARQWLSGA